MAKILRSKRSDLSQALKHGYKKPSWCTKENWNTAKAKFQERDTKHSQQIEARKTQLQSQGTSRLGSGGKTRMQAVFVSISASISVSIY